MGRRGPLRVWCARRGFGCRGQGVVRGAGNRLHAHRQLGMALLGLGALLIPERKGFPRQVGLIAVRGLVAVRGLSGCVGWYGGWRGVVSRVRMAARSCFLPGVRCWIGCCRMADCVRGR